MWNSGLLRDVFGDLLTARSRVVAFDRRGVDPTSSSTSSHPPIHPRRACRSAARRRHGVDRRAERRRDHRGRPINGATTKARNPHVPITEDELVADAHACFDAGAAIVHHHIAGDRAERRRGRRGVPRRVAARPARAPRRAVVPDDQHRPVGPLVRPHHAAGRVRAAADEPERPRLGEPRPPPRRRAERSLRVRQQLRRHRPPVRRCAASTGSARASPSTSPGSCASCSPTTRPARCPAGCFVKLYLSADRGLAGAPFGLPPTRPGARRLPRAARGHRADVGGVGGRRRPQSLEVCRRRARRRRPPPRRSRVLRRRPHADERRARRGRRQGVPPTPGDPSPRATRPPRSSACPSPAEPSPAPRSAAATRRPASVRAGDERGTRLRRRDDDLVRPWSPIAAAHDRRGRGARRDRRRRDAVKRLAVRARARSPPA